MSTRYPQLLAGIATALGAINPARMVTRTWQDFGYRPAADLARGVWVVRPADIGPYDYETSDNQTATDSLRATQISPLQVTILGQLQLAQGATGEDVDAAEFGLIHELEQLADAAMAIPGLEGLRLQRVQMSQQIECPYAWVMSTWTISPY